MKTRRYSELLGLQTFEERFDYLELHGIVGQETFGFDRWINQRFYTSREWKSARDFVIIRDEGCDLGIPGYEIRTELLVHHVNPMTPRDIEEAEDWIFDPEFLITTSKRTHNALHYGNRSLLPKTVLQRTPGDTRLW